LADALHLVAIGLRLRGLVEIEQPSVPGRDLDALVAEPRGPLCHRRQAVERRCVTGELRQEDRGTLHRRRHVSSPRLSLGGHSARGWISFTPRTGLQAGWGGPAAG